MLYTDALMFKYDGDVFFILQGKVVKPICKHDMTVPFIWLDGRWDTVFLSVNKSMIYWLIRVSIDKLHYLAGTMCTIHLILNFA